MAETSPDPATPLTAAAAVHWPLPATSLPPATPLLSVAALGPSPSSGLLDYSAASLLPSDLCSRPNSCTPLTHHPRGQPFAGSRGSNDSGKRQQQTRSSQGPASHGPRFPILSGPVPSTLRPRPLAQFPWLHRGPRPGDQPTECGDKPVQEGQITQLQPEDQRERAKDHPTKP